MTKFRIHNFRLFPSDEKPFSCEYCQTLFRRKDNLNRHIRHHHTEDFSCEVRKTSVETDQACSVKNQQRQKQKSKKTQPKNIGKVTAAYASSRDQINSRLDSMGNITPVIRATSEVSNAVPVINGPINIRRLEDRTDRIFTYTEPIPIAEAVVLNCRIEEKLYPESASSHNYFVRSYLKDKNSKVNSYPNNKLASQENHNFAAATCSQTEALPRVTVDQEDSTTDAYKEKLTRCVEEKSSQNENENEKEDERDRERRRNHEDPGTISFRESNCVSTIKKHTTQQSGRCLNENSVNSNLNTTNHTTLPKDSQNSCEKKQSDMHWRRRITETLKPSWSHTNRLFRMLRSELAHTRQQTIWGVR